MNYRIDSDPWGFHYYLWDDSGVFIQAGRTYLTMDQPCWPTVGSRPTGYARTLGSARRKIRRRAKQFRKSVRTPRHKMVEQGRVDERALVPNKSSSL